MIEIRHTALSSVIVATVITPGSAAMAASSLDEETTRQLAGRCMVLGRDASFGPQLSAICDTTSPPVSGDIGGGVSATGSASTSPGRRLLDDVLSFRPKYDAAEDDKARTGSQHSTMAHRAFSDALDASWFIRGAAGAFERDTTDLESGSDATLYSLFTGLRSDVGESAILGFGLEYARIDADDFNIGGFDSVVYGPTMFAAFRPGNH